MSVVARVVIGLSAALMSVVARVVIGLSAALMSVVARVVIGQHASTISRVLVSARIMRLAVLGVPLAMLSIAQA